ncbi:MAG: Sec-independent protein translocase TatB, partial [Microterricola sp.]
MRDEMGPEFDDVDWKKLDPRQYDPRRIIREALTDDTPDAATAAAAAPTLTRAARSVTPARTTSAPLAAGEAAPFDSEAT